MTDEKKDELVRQITQQLIQTLSYVMRDGYGSRGFRNHYRNAQDLMGDLGEVFDDKVPEQE